jgi:hypothetical protein
MRQFIPFLFVAAVGSAQIVSVGVKAGVPVTEAVRFSSSDTAMIDTGRWTIGPTIEFRLLYGFSVEADALYRGYRLQNSAAFGGFVFDGITYPAVFNSFRQDTKIWDFPLLLKYRFGSQKLRPFLDAGYTWSHTTSDVTSSLICVGTADACALENLRPNYYVLGHTSSSNTPSGPTAGIGVEFKYGRMKIAPEVRYTHFSNPTANNATVMFGVTF